MEKKNILFLTGTRADFGKLKSLMLAVNESANFNCFIFATGMHQMKLYGLTVKEVMALNIPTHNFLNQVQGESMEIILANTITGLSRFLHENKMDMIIVHGDRVEALAGALSGLMNNILVAHIEGGERSGTVDEMMRHAISKLSHLHFVANEEAKLRLIQMGEAKESIFVIGSPDIDLIMSNNLPSIDEVKKWYDIKFKNYSVVLYHPVTTEVASVKKDAKNLVEALLESERNYIVIYPNNDEGSSAILDEYRILENNKRFKLLPSMKFEKFSVLLRNADFLIGNSSAGVRECPIYGKPSINIGTRQEGRFQGKTILNSVANKDSLFKAIQKALSMKSVATSSNFGDGKSTAKFMKILQNKDTWGVNIQKKFHDI